MNINYRKCGCGVMLRPLEQCSACLSLRRAEAMAKAGPRAEAPPLVIRGWAPPGWAQMELLPLWMPPVPHGMPRLTPEQTASASVADVKRLLKESESSCLKAIYPDAMSECLKIIYRG
jgi:hypothetical protein